MARRDLRTLNQPACRWTAAAGASVVVALVVGVSLTASCLGAPIAGPVTVEAIAPDASAAHGVSFRDVTLETVVDLSTGVGTWFDMRGGLQLGAVELVEALAADDSMDTMRDRLRADGGHTLMPRMHFDGTRWVAEDHATLTSFSAWHAFEEALGVVNATAGPDAPAQSHGLIGLEAQVVATTVFPMPILWSDNAAYAAPMDAWLLMRSAAQEGLPFAMAASVVAHETHHRTFHHNVFGTDAAFEVFRALVSARGDTPEARARRRSLRIIKAVDEGLADLFSIAVTGDVQALPRTFAQAGGAYAVEAERRDVEGSFADAATYDALRTFTLAPALLDGCHTAGEGERGDEDLFARDTFNPYCLGTVLARALWDGSERDAAILRGETFIAVETALRMVEPVLRPGAVFDMHVFLAPLVDALPPGRRRARMCTALGERFASIAERGEVPGC